MITDTFSSKSEPILKPDMICKQAKGKCDICIMMFSHKIVKIARTIWPTEVIGEVGTGVTSIPVYKTTYKGTDVCYFAAPYGAPPSAACLAEANHLLGAKKFIVFGSCGLIDTSLTGKKIIVPTKAYRDEGLSYHYAAPSDYIEMANCKKVCSMLEALGVDFGTGKTWSTDAIYQETGNEIAMHKADGCVCVEMEASALQAISDYYGVELYYYFFTGDVLDEVGWSRENYDEANHSISNIALGFELATMLDR